MVWWKPDNATQSPVLLIAWFLSGCLGAPAPNLVEQVSRAEHALYLHGMLTVGNRALISWSTRRVTRIHVRWIAWFLIGVPIHLATSRVEEEPNFGEDRYPLMPKMAVRHVQLLWRAYPATLSRVHKIVKFQRGLNGHLVRYPAVVVKWSAPEISLSRPKMEVLRALPSASTVLATSIYACLVSVKSDRGPIGVPARPPAVVGHTKDTAVLSCNQLWEQLYAHHS